MKRQTRLFPKAVVALERLGENIKLARRRRGITSALMAERADMSLMTLRAIERGSPKVAMGNYRGATSRTHAFCVAHGREARDERVGHLSW